jgi:hypothetical protein
MATAWGWSEKRVRTFLNRRQKVGMIDLQAGRLQTVITIYNYDTYQGARDEEARQTGPQTGRQRAGKGPEEEDIKEGNNRYSARKAAKNPRGWPEDGFERWYALYPRKKDRAAAEKAFAKARANGLIVRWPVPWAVRRQFHRVARIRDRAHLPRNCRNGFMAAQPWKQRGSVVMRAASRMK